MFKTLHAAIFSGWADGADLSRVQELLDQGHDVNGFDADGNTPLASAALVAAAGERSELATRLLLAHGADPNKPCEGGRTPLLIAVCGIGTGTVEALLEGGAEPDRPSPNGATPVHHALSELRRAASRGRFDSPDSGAAVAADFVSSHIRSLARHGADLNHPSPAGHAPLAIASCIDGCPDAVLEALLDGGADPVGPTASVDGVDVDLLSMCIFSELSATVARRFLAAGCPYDVPYKPFGDRPFIEVAPQYRPAMALELAQHDTGFAEAMVRFRGTGGLSLLAVAAGAGHEPLVRWLMGQGLRPEDRGEGERNAYDVAEKHGQDAIVALMRALA